MTLSEFVILFSFLLEVILTAIAYLAGMNAPHDDMPDFRGFLIGIIGTLSLIFIFFLNIAFTFVGEARKIGHLAIAFASIVTFILIVCIEKHFNQ